MTAEMIFDLVQKNCSQQQFDEYIKDTQKDALNFIPEEKRSKWFEPIYLYDSLGNQTNLHISKGLCHQLGLPHGASDCLIRVDQNKFFIFQRADTLLWDAGVGGHHTFGVSIKENMMKEIMEELFNILDTFTQNVLLQKKLESNLNLISKSVNENFTKEGHKNIHVSSLFVLDVWDGIDNEIHLDKSEVMSYRKLPLNEIEMLIDSPTTCSGYKLIWKKVFSEKLLV